MTKNTSLCLSNYRLRTLFFLGLFCISALLASSAAAAPEQKEPELASVAILEFSNRTGSKDYDWLKTSLPDGINDSMKERFEFKRTGKEQILAALKKRGKKSLDQLNAADTRFIAKTSKSDIIILGDYTYNKETKKITIIAEVYHVSRNSITAKLDIKTAVDSSMFNVVDKVAEKIIAHIGKIATEDMDIPAEKTPGPEKTQKKIVLKKAKGFEYESWYIDLSNSFAIPIGDIRDGTNGGTTFSCGVFNSYNSFLHFGGSFTAQVFYIEGNEGSDNGTGWSSSNNLRDFFMFSLKGNIGLNFMFFNRFVLEPYVSAGYSMILLKIGTSNDNVDKTTNIYGNPVASLGLRVPVRLGGIFLTPYIEYCQIFDSEAFMGAVHLGLGVSF
ncbi:MAG: hypothetical protein GY754_35160 [bacterium]|nr:hypothetical protein [bacterium]